MAENQFRFDDGAGYERYMGKWSQPTGRSFLDWLQPDAGWRWLDVGCGNGAFTELLFERCAPAAVAGIDPSEAQLAYARIRFEGRAVDLRQADAMALPFEADTFDAAVMPLVIFFVPEPAVGVAEMARVVRPGGTVSAYAWDMPGQAFPYAVVMEELRALGLTPPTPANPEASRLDVLQQLWAGAGLRDVRTTAITVERTFGSFAEYWDTLLCAPTAASTLKVMDAATAARLQDTLQRRLPADAEGRITYSARAHAVAGIVA